MNSPSDLQLNQPPGNAGPGSGVAAGFEQRLLARARAINVGASSCLLVAFSGGPDSLALAAALTHVRAVTGARLVLAHIDHGLRPSSADEARLVIALGDGLGCEVIVRRVERELQGAGAGVEDAARRERYRLLRCVTEQVQADLLVTAHQLDDQAETVLLHLLRGSGLTGARGMGEISEIPSRELHDISHQSLTGSARLWRPLLSESRQEIIRYLAGRRLTPLLDPSNASTDFRRNWLRHDILPVLEERMPGAGAALARYAALAADDDELLAALAADALAGAMDPETHLVAARLRAHPVALQRRVVRGWLAQQIGLQDLSAERVEAVRRLAENADNGRVLELAGGWRVQRVRGILCVTAIPSRA